MPDTAEAPFGVVRRPRGRPPGKKNRPKREGTDPGKILTPGSGDQKRGPGIAFAPLPNQRLPGDKRKLAIDWSVVATEYIDGKIVDDKVRGGFKKVYPTFAELELRYGVPKSTIAYQCQRGKWGERRLAINQQVLAELETELSKRRALEISDVVATLDDFLNGFAREVKGKKVKATNISEYERALRLRVYALSEMRERSAGAGVVTLEQLQSRHTKMREASREVAPETAGYIGGRAEREQEGEIEQQAQAKADLLVAEAKAKAEQQAVRAETHLASLGRARQANRDAAQLRRVNRYRERSRRLAALDPWSRALFLTAHCRSTTG